MLNPSTADATEDDATIRRCIGFSQRWGYGGLTVRNLYTLRATDPSALETAEDAIGPDADKLILDMVGDCEMIVCAWGAYPKLNGRDKVVTDLLRNAGAKLVCLGRTKDGHPKHPCRLASATVPIEF